MQEDALESRAALAETLASEAGRLADSFWRGRDALEIELKTGKLDLVSEADRAVERMIRDGVAARFPEDGFLGEEFGTQPGSSGFTWVIDPIDGTAPFLAGIPNWCVSIGLAQEGCGVAGAIAIPSHGEIFSAWRGGGARLNGAPLRMPADRGLGDGQTGLGASHRTDPDRAARLVAELMRRGGMFFRNGSGAIMLAYVAAGRLVGYFEPHMHAWDCLAGLLIIEEAGGRVEPYCPDGDLGRGGRVVAAGPGAWDELNALIEAAG